jgi:SAM-dependent methyltransferase
MLDATRNLVSATGIRVRNSLFRNYSRRGAKRYETRRQSVRWAAEASTFDNIYKRINPKKVLDLPVGTGRFVETYLGNGAEVVGVDISQNMLEEAAAKVPPGGRVELRRADVLSLEKSSDLGRGYDLIVCMRFIYWLRPHELAIMLRAFNATGAPLIVASTKVALDHRAPILGGGWTRSLGRLRAHLYRSVIKRVYSEDKLLRIFAENGWVVAERHPLVTTRNVRYLCFLFESSAAGSARVDRTSR